MRLGAASARAHVREDETFLPRRFLAAHPDVAQTCWFDGTAGNGWLALQFVGKIK